MSNFIQRLSRTALGGALIVTGITHLTSRREEFQVQVPEWLSPDADEIVVLSGIAEIMLGLGLIFAGDKDKGWIGRTTAAFLAAIFPGNIAQFAEGRDGFGLDTDYKRFLRLLGQPALIYLALKSTSRD